MLFKQFMRIDRSLTCKHYSGPRPWQKQWIRAQIYYALAINIDFMEKSSDYFILSVATRDNRVVAKSLADMINISSILQRHFVLNVQAGTGIVSSRTKCIEAIKKWFPGEDRVYTFWLDSDIVLNEKPETIAEYVKEAERRNMAFAGNYHVIDNNTNQMWNTVAKKHPNHYTNEELASAKPFELKCEYAGLGLCYINTPTNYMFRTVGHDLEDMLFFKDNPDIDLRYVPISNVHMKTVYI